MISYSMILLFSMNNLLQISSLSVKLPLLFVKFSVQIKVVVVTVLFLLLLVLMETILAKRRRPRHDVARTRHSSGI